MKFHAYQAEANEAITKALLDNNKCIVKMFCGTGKSLLMRKCDATVNKPLIVYVFPILALIEQFYSEYLHDHPTDHILKVSSDDDNVSTTDVTNIRQFLASTYPHKIICVTYQSYKTLLAGLGETQIDVCLYDEAHHVVGKTYQNLIFQNAEHCAKQIFFTATPNNANGIVMYDRYKPETNMCGPLAYDYSYLRGVNEGYLNPFEIRIDLFMENTKKSVFETIARAVYTSGNTRVLTFHTDVNTDRDKSVCNFVDEAEMCQVFQHIGETEFPDHPKYKQIHMIELSANIPPNKRKTLLKKFDATHNDAVYIISSCETIGEGIDTKNANMCVFVDPKSSYTKIIQNIGRIVRRPRGVDKPRSTVLLPCWVDKTKYESCDGDREKCDEVIRQDMGEGGNFNGILNVMSALKQEDEELYDICLHYPDTYAPSEIHANLARQGYKVLDVIGEGAVLENVEYLLGEELDWEEYEDCETDEDMLMRVAEEHDVCVEVHTTSMENPIEVYNRDCESGEIIRLFKSVEEEDEEGEERIVYQPVVKREGGKRRGKGLLGAPERKKRLGVNVHCNPDVKVLWKITEGDLTRDICSCVMDCEVVDKWYERLEELKKFIDENKQRPSRSKELSEKQLSNWLSNQLKNYKKCINSMKNEDKRKLWSQFLEDYHDYVKSNDDIWYETFEELKLWINTNKKRPAQSSNENSEKRLGQWVSNQQTNYNQHKSAFKDKRKLWSQFLEDYSEYFKGFDDIWYETFEELKLWINKNAKQPSKRSIDIIEKQLGMWTGQQQNNYKQKIQSMNDETKYKLWSQFLDDYNQHFKSDHVIWYEMIKELKIWIDKNKKRPSHSTVNTIERRFGQWVCQQLNNYKKNINAMKNEKIYKAWAEFLEEYKEYFKNDDVIWYEMFDELKIWIDNHKKRPNKRSNDANEKRLGLWISHQQTNYKQQKGLMKDKTKHEVWSQFLEEYTDYINLLDNDVIILADKHTLKEKSEDDVWYEKFEELKLWIDNNKKRPSADSKYCQEKHLGSWSYNQQTNYKNKMGSMKDEHKYKAWTQFLEEHQEYFKSFDGVWHEKLKMVKLFITQNLRIPTDRSNNSDEKTLGKWISHQRTNYKQQKNSMKDEDKRTLWEQFLIEYAEYFNTEPISNINNINDTPIPTQEPTPPPTPNPKPKPMKKMKLIIANPNNPKIIESPTQRRERTKTELSTLHQRYKTLNSVNLQQEFQQSPQLWHKYHEIAEENETSFPSEEIPRNRIIHALNQIQTKRTKTVIDMGCGKASIAHHYTNDARFHFINYDHIACNDTVVSCDISQLPHDDIEVEVCILCLAMWGSNCHDYIKEAHRVLETGGRLYIAEPTKRWTPKDEAGNCILGEEGKKLMDLVITHGFQMVKFDIGKFCYMECVKV